MTSIRRYLFATVAALVLLCSGTAAQAQVKPQVSAGQSHTVALRTNGTVWAWGYNLSGQLGNGTIVNSTVPVQTTGLVGVTKIAAGAFHSIALKSDGTLWTWGYNLKGQLGTGSLAITNSSLPVQVTGLTGTITAIAGGYSHSVALKSDGTVWAWGDNEFGQLGNGTNTNSSVPVQVSGLTTVTAISAGAGHTIARLSDGTVRAWGDNRKGQLGDGTFASSNLPVTVGNPSVPSQASVASPAGTPDCTVTASPSTIASGSSSTLTATCTNTTYPADAPISYAWTPAVGLVPGTGASANTAVVTPAAAGQFLYSVIATNIVGAGSAAYGGLAVTLGVTVKDVKAGAYFSLALLDDGTMRSWGEDGSGQSGNGTAIDGNPRSSLPWPTIVTLMSGVTDIAAGYYHSLALKSDGTVWAWGYSFSPSAARPGMLAGLSGVTAITGGQFHSAVLEVDGVTYAFGANGNGQLGNGTTADPASATTLVRVHGAGDVGYFNVRPAPPTCTLAASPTSVVLLVSSTLTASCAADPITTDPLMPVSDPVTLTWTAAADLVPGPVLSVTATMTPQVIGTATVTPTAVGIRQYFVTGNNSAGAGNTASVLVTAIGAATPACVISSSLGSITIGGSATLTATCTPAADSYTWTPAVGLVAGTGNTATITPPAVGTFIYSVTGNNAAGAGTLASLSIDVTNVAAPDCVLTAFPSTITLGQTTTLTATCNPAATTYTWTNASGLVVGAANTATVTPTATGVYTYTVKGGNAGGIGIAASVNVTVNAVSVPSCTLTSSPASLIIGDSATLTATCSPAATSYSWTSATGLVPGAGNTATITPAAIGTATYSVRGNNDGGPGNLASVNVVVSSLPTPTCSLSASPVTLGLGASTTLTATCSPAATSYSWTPAAGLMAGAGNTAIVTPSTVGDFVYSVQGVNAAGTGSIASTTVTVNATGSGPVKPLIAAGQSHTVVLRTNGTVWAWGYNLSGQLGNGTIVNSTTPVQTTGLVGITKIAAGAFHSVALKSDGTLWTWGYNMSGQLGTGSLGITNSSLPVKVTGLTGTILAIAAGYSHTVILKSDGTVWAWGDNAFGQLGNGSNINSSLPVQVTGLTNVRAISAGAGHTLALLGDGTVRAWGNNREGELGDGSFVSSNVPVTVKNELSAGSYTYLKPLGGDDTDLIGSGFPNKVKDIAAGAYHNLALMEDGSVRFWGFDLYGQSADLTNITGLPRRSIPGGRVVATFSGVSDIAAGYQNSLALKSDGTLWGWGDNYNPTGSIAHPVLVDGLSGVTEITGGQFHTAVLEVDGTAYALGANSNGQLGNGSNVNPATTITPVRVHGATDIGYFNVRPAPPTCAVTASPTSVNLGSAATLTVSCTQEPVSTDTATPVFDTITYTWTGANGLVAGTPNTVNTAVATPQAAGVSQYFVTGNNSAGAGNTATVQVTAIGGTTPACIVTSSLASITLGGSATLTATCTPVATSYAWTAAVGLVAGTGNKANTAVVTPTAVGSPAYSVTGSNAAGSGALASLAIPVIGVAVPDCKLTASFDTITLGATVTLTASCNPDATSYTWTNAAGLVAGSSNTATVKPTAAGVYLYSVKGSNSGGTGSLASTFVIVESAPTPVCSLSASPGTFTVGGSTTLTATCSPAATSYTWTSADGLVAGSGNTATVTPTLAGLYQYSVVANNAGGAGNAASVTVLVNNKPPTCVLTASPGTITIVGFSTLTVSCSPGATSYSWSNTNFGSGIDSGNVTPSTTTTYSVVGSNDAGSGNVASVTVTVLPPPAVTALPQIVTGSGHTMGLKSDGTVWSWGYNLSGQLGNGTANNSNTPVQVTGLTGVRVIAAGALHSVAVKKDGTVWTWGHNGYGQLGDGSINNALIPVQVLSLNGVVGLAAGQYFTAVLKSDGTVWTWGYNSNGQLGNGTQESSRTPVQVIGLAGVTAIAAGASHTVALKSDGTVWAWGYNSNGQLGNGSNAEATVPVQVTGVSAIKAIAAGGAHTVALNGDGTVLGWGMNGINSTIVNQSNTPMTVSGITGVTAIAAGQFHTSALKIDRTVWSWGHNGNAQLGNGNTVDTNTPVQVYGLDDVTAIAASGASHTVALKFNGSVWSWGYNDYGQLGDGGNAVAATPVQTVDLNAQGFINLGGIVVTQTVASYVGNVGKDLVYKLALGNNGPGVLSGVTLTDTLPAGAVFVWASPGCGNSGGTVTCSIGTMASGTVRELLVVVRPGAIGPITNSVGVSGLQSDNLTSNYRNSITFTSNSTPAASVVPRYRLYNSTTLEHLFTTDLNEYTVLGAVGTGWQQEGTAGKVLNNPGSYNGVTAVPYYRLFNSTSRWHHWTTDLNEYYTLFSYAGWQGEGADGYILPTSTAGATRIFRLGSLAVPGLHHWTIDVNEYNTLLSSGWIAEGGAGYVIQ